ncbi:MAG: PqiC family protein [Gammaproteobacteria bacterium]
MKRKCSWLAGAVALAVMLAGGCAGKSPSVSFYTLGVDAPVMQAESAGTVCSEKGVGVGVVSWPRYLDQPRIVTRDGPNRMDFDEFHRWGGSLQDDFKRVLMKYLSGLLQSSKVADMRISRRFKPDYKIELDVRQFDGQLGGEVLLDVGWLLIDQKSSKVISLHDSAITKQVSGQDYEALVHASTMAVAELSGEIAAELLKVCSANK